MDKRTDGTIVGAWCWNNGYDIKNDLKRDFKSLLDVEFILEVGMFSTIYSKKEYEDFIEWSKAENIDIHIANVVIRLITFLHFIVILLSHNYFFIN